MSPEQIARHHLSLRAWMHDCVLPVALALMFILFAAMTLGLGGEVLDVLAGALGFSAVLIAAWQGMDRMSARRVHDALLAERPVAYRRRLAAGPAPETAAQALRLINAIDRDLHA